MRQFERTLLSAIATDEASEAFEPENLDLVANGYTHIVEWGTGVTAGVVEIEGSHDADYAGTWATIHTFTYASGSPKMEYVFSPAVFPAFRHRISTAIADGTVTTKICGAI